MFENKYLKEYGIHYSRIISSWMNAGGLLKEGKDRDDFRDWLKNTEVLTDEQIDDIYRMATNGKLEWEANARLFLSNKK